MILEVIFEPTFSDNSHGFRPGRSCHTALKKIKERFGGDISKCFDSFDQDVLMKIIEQKIKDRRFTDLIRKALKAGYMEFIIFKHSISEAQARIHKLILKTPYYKAMDPSFNKLTYDDCITILDKIKIFLKQELNLELSDSKTLITNAKEGKARFLGTDIFRKSHQSFSSSQFGFIKRNGREVRLEAPKQRILKKLTSVGFVENRNRISSSIHYILKTSCVKLLAAKFKLETQNKVFTKFGSNLKGENRISFLDACAVCDSDYRVEMHHVRMKDLNPKLKKIVDKRNRKQIPLCRTCHLAYHHKGDEKNHNT
ncbi:putative 91 kDa protein in cob intron [Erysiphe neolycopersici]|uniref:Putative 91 kDa protein in cob intron n=1 Tax=Erysiphe neolycopersici TaxID=212602 RepID=A0A420I039_9PEZI|nr:putative 91 kDa protein in cob intron [Erysiphe neolycopersici]